MTKHNSCTSLIIQDNPGTLAEKVVKTRSTSPKNPMVAVDVDIDYIIVLMDVDIDHPLLSIPTITWSQPKPSANYIKIDNESFVIPGGVG